MTPEEYIELTLHQLVLELDLGYDAETMPQAQSSLIVVRDTARYLVSRGRPLNAAVRGFCEKYDLIA
jgi:hypothetical protein